jgi:hypothetical protein
MAVYGVNDMNFDSFFQERIVDNNGISVTDINAGLRNLFYNFNEKADDFNPTEMFFVTDVDTGYPELIAKKSVLEKQGYWWWITLLNRLENPMTDFKTNWVYSINSTSQITSFINETNENISSNNNNRIGKVVELN